VVVVAVGVALDLVLLLTDSRVLVSERLVPEGADGDGRIAIQAGQ
jgi:hypothetical protein